MTYCIDTSSVIDAGERHYPQDIFPGFWEKVESLIDSNRLHAPQMLITELGKNSDEWRKWVYDRAGKLILPHCSETLQNLTAVMEVYSARTTRPEAVTGDPFFIACCLTHGLTLITSEQARRGNIKMPLICRELGVKTVSILDLARQERWSF